jgi:hypothetical protein
MSAPECAKFCTLECRRPKRTTCIEALADGWINPPDLCGPCTQAFMVALDGIAGPMKWHHGYTARAAMD